MTIFRCEGGEMTKLWTDQIVSESLDALDGSQLQEAFSATDLLGKVLRTSIEIEVQIDRLIEHFTEIRVNDGMGLTLKCTLLKALRWPKTQILTIERFGNLRNRLAHKKTETAAQHKIDSLIEAIITDHGMEPVGDINRWTFELPGTGKLRAADMENSQKLVLVGTLLASFLALAPDTHSFSGLVENIRLKRKTP